MPIPRYVDDKGIPYDVSLFCPKCGWAVIKDRITANWTSCRYCGSEHLDSIKSYYPNSPVPKSNNGFKFKRAQDIREVR